MLPPDGPDIPYINAARHDEQFYNPFSPVVAEKQEALNRMMMEAAKPYPNIFMAWDDGEIADSLSKPNLNEGGKKLMAERLGFTEEEVGKPRFVAKNVIADDDRLYLLKKYIYQGGNGMNLGLQRMDAIVKEYRPDILTMTDPYRELPFFGVYPDVDIIHTWTYTSIDPKMALFIETLRTACQPEGQIPFQVITVLNYPGTIAPTQNKEGWDWMAMGPDRLKATTWINLSRAAKIVGYFFGSGIDPVVYADNHYRVPPETPDAIKDLSDKVFMPYGAMIKKLDVAKRRVALLNSAAARLYWGNKIENLYTGSQVVPFQTVLEMAHYQTDVLFDENTTLENLKNYDALMLPMCGVLTESVVQAVLDFQKAGGIVVSDQFLGPEIPGVTKFDFDFSFYDKVSADAIVRGLTYDNWDDHVTKEEKINYRRVTGVPADQAQRQLEIYAETLKEGLKEKIPHQVDCDTPTALFNICENDGIRYLFVINDNRTYDERVGKYKGSMEKVVPQTIQVRYRDENGRALTAYDLLERKALPAETKDGVLTFPVNLTQIGGTIIALYPNPLEKLSLETPKAVILGKQTDLKITFTDSTGKPAAGLQPLKVEILDPEGTRHEDSGYVCAEKGSATVAFFPAWNDKPGLWTVTVSDLTAGLETVQEISVTEAAVLTGRVSAAE